MNRLSETPSSSRPNPKMSALRVWRLEPGKSAYVKLLADNLGGLFVHWKGRRSIYCRGEDCPHILHQTEMWWKGYVAAHVWHAPTKLWYPVVAEITEHAELDLRGQVQRGTVWLFERQRAARNEKTPLTCTLAETLPYESTPEPFEIVGVLCQLYHVGEIDLTARNPLPDRVTVQAVSAPGPLAAQSDEIASPVRTATSGVNGRAR